MKAQRVFVIAEAGVNHNGDPRLAIALADAALAAGADAVKFQTFRAEDVVTQSAPTADYQRTNTGATSQFEMVKALELSEDGHRQVGELGLGFYATKDYLARHGTPMSFDDLDDHAVIGFDSPARGISELPGLNRPVSRDTFTFRSDNDLAQLAALRAGFGVGVAQHGIAHRHGLTRVMPNVNAAVTVANHDDGLVPQFGRDVIAGLRHLAYMADE